ncbi:MAG: hypothetical protein ACKVQW_02650 [Pyrinomonadaceae bacterium]
MEEAWQTSKFLGVAVKDFPAPQGIAKFDEIPNGSPQFKFGVAKRPRTGPTPQPSYETRALVKATAADGTVYEAFCGRFDAKKLWPGFGESSTSMNTRQQYESHYGYGYSPADVFIGKRDRGKIRTSLFFRDIGSHQTAPHYIALDSKGYIHLIIADVNISDDNELNVYAVTGDPKKEKWLEAWLLDRRGFTSWSYPWAGTWRDSVHLLWNWGDASYNKTDPNMGLFYVEQTSGGLGKKIRIIDGLIESYDAAIDAKTGRLLIAAAREDGIFLSLRNAESKWEKPARLDPMLDRDYDVSVTSNTDGTFVIRTSWQGNREWVVIPKTN